jgi:hypothetical protein
MAGAMATYAACQSGCNAAWVACCAALGYTAGTVTAGSWWHTTTPLPTPLPLVACI